MPVGALQVVQLITRSSVPPVGLGIMALPSLPPTRCSLVESVSLAETTGFFAGGRKATGFTMLMYN